MRTLRALMLVLVLSACTYAGNMPMGVVDPPPAPGAAAQIGTGDTDPITEIAVNLFQSVLSLL
ncbi:MAG TPA: hypothetical protein VF528_14520 [Pyrinomonadaceae bacterium]